MVRESYAATVARHTAILEELHLHLIHLLPAGQRVDLLRSWNVSMHEIEKATLLRMQRSSYEAQRRDGVELAKTALTILGYRVDG